MPSLKLTVFAASKAVGLFALARWLTRRHLKILCYHGFELKDETRFRPKLFIDEERFRNRLALIERHGMQVLALDDAVARLYAGTLPANALVITIDDGFHSVSTLAAPLLQAYRFPATVYVTSYYVEHPNPIFRLVVQYMFWKTRRQELRLDDGLGADGEQFDLTDPQQRDRATWAVIDHGERHCTEARRTAICQALGGLLSVPYADIVGQKILNLMTPEQLSALGSAGLGVELHTHRHHFSGDDRAAAEREIRDNRAALQRWVSKPAVHFCYPSGLWTPAQWTWLDELGVRSSTTCLPGLNSANTPRHALRRFLDGANIEELEFEAALCGFSDLLRGLKQAIMTPGRWMRRSPVVP